MYFLFCCFVQFLFENNGCNDGVLLSTLAMVKSTIPPHPKLKIIFQMHM